jgi:3D-(3,5/4)-trihydroxycyclohexane-1,2-dione acylhydrolase (decyclizing)
MAELYEAIEDSKKIENVPVLFDIKVLPKSMTEGYGAWWRCGDVEVSERPEQLKVYEDHLAHEKTARKY